MDDEDDARSSPPTSPSSGSSQRAGHANAGNAPAVTVAAAPVQALALAVPISQHTKAASGGDRGGGGGGSGGREDCWSEGATSVLIDAWGERYLELSRGNLRQKHWQEVADIVSARDDYTKPPKSDVQCKNRIDTLKKKYKLEKSRTGASGPSKWTFFKRLEHLLGPSNHNPASKTPPSSSSPPPPPLPAHPKAKAKAAAKHLQLLKPPPTSNLPVAFPVGPRSFHHFQKKNHHHAQLPNPRSRPISSKTAAVAAAAAAAAASPDSSGCFPPKGVNGKKRKSGRDHPPPPVTPAPAPDKAQDGAEGLRELTRAILNFGEVYERVESSKLQQVVEMEKQRMGFVKELELQRMQFFMKTQMELTQLKRNGRAAAAGAAANNNNNSDNTD